MHLVVSLFSSFFVSTVLIITIFKISNVESHGRLIEPPSRSSMWRYGFNTTANYNDHEIYCGGFSRQYQKNNGKCGICGDAYDMPQPRPNEAGGVYGQGILVRKYRANSIIRIKVELTANHRGHFEFRLCPNNNPKKIATQKCLDNHLLQQSNGDGPKYFPGEGSKVFESRYLLPKDLTCTQCVLQWRYIAGNNWGTCSNGSQGVGCGPQEEFRACADVGISDSKGHASSEASNDVEDEDEKNNEIDVHKFSDENELESPWPFIMIVLAFIAAALSFSIIFAWFYRQKISEFLSHPKWKLQNTLPPPVPPPRHKKTSTSDLINSNLINNYPINSTNYSISSNLAHVGPTEELYSEIISPPDVIISNPRSVTINGLAI